MKRHHRTHRETYRELQIVGAAVATMTAALLLLLKT